MATARYDPPWEEEIRKLMAQGISILSERRGKDFESDEELLSYLSPNTKEELLPLIERYIYDLNTVDRLRTLKDTTLLWLVRGGLRTLLDNYSIKEIVWLDNFRFLWEFTLIDLDDLSPRNDPESVYQRPKFFNWAVYFTIKKKDPPTFNSNDNSFVFLIEKFVYLLEKVRNPNRRLEEDLTLEERVQLEIKLKNIRGDIYPRLKKEGIITQESIEEERQEVKKQMDKAPPNGIPSEVLKYAVKLYQEGKSVAEINSILQPPKKRKYAEVHPPINL